MTPIMIRCPITGEWVSTGLSADDPDLEKAVSASIPNQ